ncbi:MAG: glycosyltransferase [Deltaproteobacteria bacterium]|nr:glycosyltransferase [Deltaproteobacteria bacterium]
MKRNLRVVLYSHDTVGFGHTRRNLLIAHTLVRHMADVLLLAGAPESTAFSIPQGAECLALPALCKGQDGRYRPRRMNVDTHDLISMRSRVIAAALEAYRPDVVIVDKVPRGAMGELDPALEVLRRIGARCILGLRDVLDDRNTVMREWNDARSDDAIRRYYDAVWVYGDPAVFDPVREYGFSDEVAAKVRYLGFLDQSRWLDFDPAGSADGADRIMPEGGRMALCLVGGGEDGAPLAMAFVRAEFPEGMTGVLLTGPLMPASDRIRLQRFAETRSHLRVVEFLSHPIPLVKRADRVVAMGGYNTVSEVLAFEKPALIVPRVRPRTEQLIRAERLKELGLIDVLLPGRVSPGELTEWLGRDLPRPRVRERIDLGGLSRIPGLMEDLVFSGAGLPSGGGLRASLPGVPEDELRVVL